ncbi:hypothetical protein B7486_60915, partial [cyanobacterium TDX16]
GAISVHGVVQLSSGTDVLWANVDRRTRRRQRTDVGSVPQGFHPPEGLSAVELVTYAGWLKGMSSRSAHRRAKEALETVGLGDRQGERIRHLSGGMRQRVGIAQAIAAEPTVLVLDEPTVGLDPEQRMAFRTLLSALAEHVIVLLSTHLTEDVERLADAVVVIDGGRVRFEGSLSEFDALAGEPDTGLSRAEQSYAHVLHAGAS